MLRRVDQRREFHQGLNYRDLEGIPAVRRKRTALGNLASER